MTEEMKESMNEVEQEIMKENEAMIDMYNAAMKMYEDEKDNERMYM